MPATPRESAADRHLANVLGAVTLAIQTRVEATVETVTELSMVQATALSALANYAAGGSTDQLRRAVGLSHSATVRLVDRLQQLGLVTRGPGGGGGGGGAGGSGDPGDPGDRRVTAVHLTPSGREVVTKIRTARNEVLREWVGRLPADQRDGLAAVLDAAVAQDVAPAPEGVEASNYVCRLCDARACGHPTRCPVTTAVRASLD